MLCDRHAYPFRDVDALFQSAPKQKQDKLFAAKAREKILGSDELGVDEASQLL